MNLKKCKKCASIRLFAVLLFLIFASLTIMQFISAAKFSNYETAPAYITNVTSDTEFTGKGTWTKYTYDVYWTYNDEEHITTIRSLIDEPDYDLTIVSVDPDTLEMTLGSTKKSLQGSLFTACIAIAAFIVWRVLLILSKNRKAEVLSNTTHLIAISLIALPITALCTYAICTDSRYSSSLEPIVMLDIVFAIALIGSIIVKLFVKRDKA